jgi:hypothetical protein
MDWNERYSEPGFAYGKHSYQSDVFVFMHNTLLTFRILNVYCVRIHNTSGR